jgi:hypothetical protein
MRALREMAVDEGYVDKNMLEEVKQLDEFTQKLRRDMVNLLVEDKAKFKAAKSKVEKAAS